MSVSAALPRRGEVLSIDQHQVHIVQAGRPGGDGVVFLHGCGSLAEEIILPFEKNRYSCLAVDRPGYGFSSPLEGGKLGPIAQAEWLEQFLDQKGLARSVIVAHSFGAAVALCLASRRPDLIRGLLLIAPCVRPVPFKSLLSLRTAVSPIVGDILRRHVFGRWPNYFVERALLSSCHPNPLPAALRGLPAAHLLTSASVMAMAAELKAFNEDMRGLGKMPSVLPMSVLFGDADRVIDPNWHLDLLSLRFANIRIERLRDVGHMPHHVAPDLACRMLDDILETTAVSAANLSRAVA